MQKVHRFTLVIIDFIPWKYFYLAGVKSTFFLVMFLLEQGGCDPNVGAWAHRFK